MILYLANLIDWSRLRELWPNIDWSIIWIAPFAYLVGLFGTGYRWHVMLSELGVVFSTVQGLCGYVIAAFYNLILPGGVGGDIVRVAYARNRTNESIGFLTSGVLLERFFGSMVAFEIGALAILVLPDSIFDQLGVVPLLLIIGMALFLTLYMIVLFLYWEKIREFFERRIKKRKLLDKMLTFGSRLTSLSWVARFRIIGGTAVYQFGDAFATYIIACAIGLNIPFAVFLMLNPLLYLSMVLPISLGGLGGREGVVVGFLALVGVDADVAAILAFLIYFNHAVIGVWGGVTQLALGLHPREDAREIEEEKRREEEDAKKPEERIAQEI